MRHALLIPARDAAASILDVLEGVCASTDGLLTPRECWVVDDGSRDGMGLLVRAFGANLIAHERSFGKGAALRTGLARLIAEGFDGALCLDADGQHDPASARTFLERAERGDVDLLCGNRMADLRAMPWARRLSNRMTSWVVSRAIGVRIEDSQCGYRWVRLSAIAPLTLRTSHFETEGEVLLKLGQSGARIASVPIPTVYDATGPSFMRPARDTIRFVAMYWRCVFGADRPSRRAPVNSALEAR